MTKYILLCCAILLITFSIAEAQLWTNGMNANSVLGKPDFVTTTGSYVADPADIAVDPSTGEVFVSDLGGNRVLRWSSISALRSGLPAEGVLGQPDFSSTSISTTQSGMSGPGGIVFDRTGTMWVVDQNNSRVLRFDNASSKANGANADGVLGQASFSTGSPSTSQSGMDYPTSLAIDEFGTLWVADYGNNRVLEFDSAATKKNGANADGVLGQGSFTSNGSGTTQSGMYRPYSVACDTSGRLWVIDLLNSRVLRFDDAKAKLNGANADGVLGQSSFTTNSSATTQSGMDYPYGLAVDSSGTLWVADYGNNRVVKFKSAAMKADGADADGVLGQSSFVTNSSACTVSGMNSPFGLMIESTGTLWVSDYGNSRLLEFDNAISKANGDNADAQVSRFMANTLQAPTDVAVDPVTKKVFVSDPQNNRVLRWSSANSLLNGSSAEAVLGQPDFFSNSSATMQAGMQTPYGIAIDSDGRLWVADYSNNRVLRYDSAAFKANGADADGVLGQSSFVGSGRSTTQSGMNGPTGVAVDTEGNLWVVDAGNNRVLRFDSASAKDNGGDANGVLGQSLFTTNSAAVTQAGMAGPQRVALDSAGRLWVTDGYRVLRFDNAASKLNGANADGVLGQSSFTTRAVSTSQSGMANPLGITLDKPGTLWVADYGNNRILRFDNAANKSNGASADGVIGQTSFTLNSSAVSQSGVHSPYGLTVDGSTRLWVADCLNGRVLSFNALLLTQYQVTSSSYSVLAGDSVTITAQALDQNNSSLVDSGAVVTWETTGGGSFKCATSETNASGIASIIYIANGNPGSTQITATTGSVTGTSSSIEIVPNPPTLVSPANDSIGLGTTASFSWNHVSGATSYELQISTDSTFVTTSVDSTGASAATDTVTGLSGLTKYFWRVRVTDSGDTSSWSQEWTFTTQVDHSLSVQATGFWATPDVGSVKLTWRTDSELRNAGFDILRKDPGTSIFKLVSGYATNDCLSGMGTSSSGRTYNFTDRKVISGDTYAYKIESVSTSGGTKELSILTVTVDVPMTYALYQNFPNPFNPSTVITYDIAKPSHVALVIYDALGREVAMLVNADRLPGEYHAVFDGSRLPSGMYFYRIQAGNYRATKKLVVVK